MSLEDQIRKAVRTIVRDMIKPHVKQLEVVSVDEAKDTIVAKSVSEKIDYPDIMLMLEDGDGGSVNYPKQGSLVAVCFLDNSDTIGFVCGFGNLTKVKLRGERFGGIPKVQELASRIAALETKHDAHVHTFAGTVAGAACSGTTNIITPDFPIKTKRADLENEKVVHG